jgi:hypothetical protein
VHALGSSEGKPLSPSPVTAASFPSRERYAMQVLPGQGDGVGHIASRQVVARGDDSDVVPGVCPATVSVFNDRVPGDIPACAPPELEGHIPGSAGFG